MVGAENIDRKRVTEAEYQLQLAELESRLTKERRRRALDVADLEIKRAQAAAETQAAAAQAQASRVRLSRIVAHSAARSFPQESVLTHRRPSNGLCRPRRRRSSVSMKQATASLARVRFVMSDRRPSGHRTRHMPG
jgi:multidrug resistance efflux pump